VVPGVTVRVEVGDAVRHGAMFSSLAQSCNCAIRHSRAWSQG
jgi:hypothetical protein